MSEMIARVQDAIRKEIGTRHQGLPRGGWDGLMKQAARAAIEAMRDLTDEMDMAGSELLPAPDGHSLPDDFRDAWKAAIDAALGTKK